MVEVRAGDFGVDACCCWWKEGRRSGLRGREKKRDVEAIESESIEKSDAIKSLLLSLSLSVLRFSFLSISLSRLHEEKTPLQALSPDGWCSLTTQMTGTPLALATSTLSRTASKIAGAPATNSGFPSWQKSFCMSTTSRAHLSVIVF